MKWILMAVLMVSSCSRNKNVVVVYTSEDQQFSQPVLKDFEKETGIQVKALYDTEETKSTGILNRLIAEKNNPQADVFWSGDPMRSILLKRKGITASYTPKNAQNIPKLFKDKEGHYTGFSARVRALIYNKNLLSKDQLPKSILELTDPKWKNKVAIANPLFGTTSFHIAALFIVMGDEKAKDYLLKLKANGLHILKSNGDVRRKVASGQIPIGFTDSDDINVALLDHKSVGFIYPDENGIGTLVMPNTVSLIKGSPNNQNAKLLIDYLISKKVELKLAQMECAQIPLLAGVHGPKGVLSIQSIQSMKIDYEAAAIKLTEILGFLKQWIED
ncbi:MAG TPA: extracellular solute-binding protein [Spirochaetes bacterium]|nr:extracellular solute-binding protein [Spirochaetota bacterium]